VQAYFQMGGKVLTFAPFATTGTYADALTLMNDPKYGPGQLAVIAQTPATPPTAQQFTDMQNAAMSNNRVALRDVASTTSVVQMGTTGAAAPPNDSYGATFGPWLSLPPPPSVVGATARTIPGSAAIAALCAQVDADGNPNRAAAGDDYAVQYATGMTLELTAANRSSLFSNGVNAFADTYGLENYGFQTNIAMDPTNPYWQFNCSRARMALVDRCTIRARPFMFRPIDGRGRLEAELQGALEDECNRLYQANAMYGDTPQDAYDVNVSSSVNTVDTIAQGELHAVASVVWTLHAVAVEVDLVTVPLGSPV
jgi:hypothetical protein